MRVCFFRVCQIKTLQSNSHSLFQISNTHFTRVQYTYEYIRFVLISHFCKYICRLIECHSSQFLRYRYIFIFEFQAKFARMLFSTTAIKARYTLRCRQFSSRKSIPPSCQIHFFFFFFFFLFFYAFFFFRSSNISRSRSQQYPEVEDEATAISPLTPRNLFLVTGDHITIHRNTVNIISVSIRQRVLNRHGVSKDDIVIKIASRSDPTNQRDTRSPITATSTTVNVLEKSNKRDLVFR